MVLGAVKSNEHVEINSVCISRHRTQFVENSKFLEGFKWKAFPIEVWKSN